MTTTKCECPAAGFCKRHKIDKSQREFELCQTDSEFFSMWETGKSPQHDRQKMVEQQAAEREGTLVPGDFPCIHRGDKTGEISCKPCRGSRLLDVFLCGKHGRCTIGAHGYLAAEISEPTSVCLTCPDRIEAKPRRVIIRDNLCPGDITVLSAAIRELHLQHPKQFETDVRVNHPSLFEGSSIITTIDDSEEGVEVIEGNYHTGEHASINDSSGRPAHFLEAYCEGLSKALGLPVLRPRHWLEPSIYLTDEERGWISQVQELTARPTRYWIINAGTKDDYTTKLWPYYQQVVDQTKHAVNWVQIGLPEHDHKPLGGAIDLIGKTNLRELVRLVYHADGVLCGVTALGHLAHWVERKPGVMRQAVIVSGGRESPHWFSYPGQHVFHTIGQLDCCERGGCWRSRTTATPGNGNESLCNHPVDGSPLCMRSLTPESVSSLILRLKQ